MALIDKKRIFWWLISTACILDAARVSPSLRVAPHNRTMARRTNLALLATLSAAFATGWLAFAYATSPARWALAVHAVSGFAIVVLVPWKSLVVQRGLRRPRPGRPASLLLGGLIVASLIGGFLHSTGLLPWWGSFTAMEVHVGAALVAVPFAVWHVLARPVRPRPADLGRRALLRAGAVAAVAGVAYAGSEGAVRLLRLPGAGRRFTGSYEAGSFRPELMPVSSWIADPILAIDSGRWRLLAGGREWEYGKLASFTDGLRAVLDCTGGFWSEQDWEGVLLDRLLDNKTGARSIRVVSATGYERRFAVEEAGRLLLALRVGGRPLDAGHGAPARLVAADRRGYWWVKWVERIELDPLPAWWQTPFPLH